MFARRRPTNGPRRWTRGNYAMSIIYPESNVKITLRDVRRKKKFEKKYADDVSSDGCLPGNIVPG